MRHGAWVWIGMGLKLMLTLFASALQCKLDLNRDGVEWRLTLSGLCWEICRVRKGRKGKEDKVREIRKI